MDITSLPGFDKSLYESFRTEYLSRTQGTAEGLDQAVMALADANIPFKDALDFLKQNVLPLLPPASQNTAAPAGIASFSAQVLALITETANDERAQARESRIIREDEVIDSMKEEAEKIRDKAVTQLVTGIISGGLSIASGVATIGLTHFGARSAENSANQARTEAQNAKMVLEGVDNVAPADIAQDVMKKINAAGTEAYQSALRTGMEKLSGNIQIAGSFIQGAASVNDGVGKYLEAQKDAEIKDTQAKTEKIRQSVDMIKDLEQSLSALIQKAQSTMDAIQANVNQTRTRILG